MNNLGVVLAGGLSSRMGSDKALLKWKGSTLLEHAVRLLQDAGASQVLVSGRPDHALGIGDLLPHAGPPAAVLALLQHLADANALDNRAVLLIPVDMPRLQAATLRALLEAAVPGEAARFAGEVFPCVLPASPALLEHLRSCYREADSPGGSRSMKGILAWLPCRELDPPPDAARQFRNINTPVDWQALQE